MEDDMCTPGGAVAASAKTCETEGGAAADSCHDAENAAGDSTPATSQVATVAASAKGVATSSRAARARAVMALLMRKWLPLFPPAPVDAREVDVKTHQLKTMMKCAMVAKLSKTDGVPVEVAPGVLLGSIGCVALQENLDAAGVTHILTVANAILPLFDGKYTYKVVSVPDAISTNLLEVVPDCIRFIDTALASGGRVLVHCFAGKSRSTTICAAYLMEKRHEPFIAVLHHIRSVRPIATPNPSFAMQLLKFQQMLGIPPATGSRDSDLDAVADAVSDNGGTASNMAVATKSSDSKAERATQ